MADDNRPRQREKNVTGPGKGVRKRGEGLGTGPVGSGSGVPGDGQNQGGYDQNYGKQTTRSGGFKMPLIIAIIVALLGGTGALSGLLNGNDPTPTPQGGDKGSYTVHSLNELVQLMNMFSTPGSASSTSGSGSGYYYSGSTGQGSGSQSVKPQAASQNSWSQNPNSGNSVNTSVAAGSREKYTKLKGNGKDTVTIMVWMCGADLESKAGMATNDLQEMASADFLTDAKGNPNINLIVCTGGARTWHIQGISNSVHQVYQVGPGAINRLVDNYGSGSMTDGNNLAEFIKLCAKNFPADRNMLIFWDHGSGSVKGYGYDELNQRSGQMSLASINSALKSAGVKFDMIGFDTCLMATAENALMLSNYADYMVASEETEPGIGWFYTNWLTTLSRNTSTPTIQIGKQICDDFTSECNRLCRGQKTTLSVVDLAELSGSMKTAFADFSTSTSKLISGNNYKAVSNARSQTREFAPSPIDQIDLVHFANNLGTTESKALSKALLSAIKYNRTSNISNAYGLSIYFPYQASKSYVNTAINLYDGIGLDDEYGKCIKNFAGMAAGGQAVSGGGQMNSPYQVLSGGGNSYTGGYSAGGYGGSSSQDVLQLLNLFMGGGTQTQSTPSYSSGYSSSPMETLAGALLSSLLAGRSVPVEETARYIAENSFDASQLEWKLYEDGYFRVVMDQTNWDLIQGLDLNMFYDDGEGYIDLGLDNTCEFDKYGNLLGVTDGSWISINEQPVAYYHMNTSEDTDGSYSISGYVPAMLNGDRAKLIVIFDTAHPYGYVAGAQMMYDDDAVESKTVDIQAGDRIDFLCDYYSYSGSYLDSYYLGDPLTVGSAGADSLKISNTLIGDGALAMYRFTDIYGQYYWTASIPSAN